MVLHGILRRHLLYQAEQTMVDSMDASHQGTWTIVRDQSFSGIDCGLEQVNFNKINKSDKTSKQMPP